MNQTDEGTARRARFEATLAQYPHLTRDRLAELIAWFRTEASARDVAMIASNDAIVEPYRRFRADHIDPLTARDVLKVITALAIVGAAILLVAWRAL